MNSWGSDTSPLIFLARMDKLEILQEFSPKLLIPEAVYTEITAKPDPAAEKFQQACQSWIEVVAVEDRKNLTFALADLHIGEAEAIVLAQEREAPRLLIDDQDARRYALRCGLLAWFRNPAICKERFIFNDSNGAPRRGPPTWGPVRIALQRIVLCTRECKKSVTLF